MDISKYKAKPDKTLREHTDDLVHNLDILKELSYIKDDHLYELTKLSCEYHDYGKVNRKFQKRIIKGTKFNENEEISHNILSLYFLDKDIFNNIKDYYRVSFAILNHHNYCNNFKVIEDSSSKELIKDLLKDFKVHPISRRTSRMLWEIREDPITILIKGILHKCDYSASGKNTIEYKNDFLYSGLSDLLRKWRIKDENAQWNSLQEFCINNTENNIIAIAQTGMGKTEAGLHWIGDNKGFFILPLRTAINSIYSRIKNDILDNEDIEHRIALLHSDALSYYNKDNNEMDIIDYYSQSKKFAIPLSISTVDQLFDFVFKYQGYELKLATLSYSKIVIDEIQMYGADILAYLICGLKRINKLGGKIAILTATLPPFIKDLLKSGKDPVEFKESTFINNIERHHIKVFDTTIDSNIIFNKYVDNQKRGIPNKILIVCNTVKKAQKIYQELLDKGILNIDILHSKFIKTERSIKEENIIRFGKSENNAQGIWVTTQVVEASLDIDFDLLFTELSDITSLFQRLGRCNRKGIKKVNEPNCFVFLEIEKNLLTNGNKGFIDKTIYNISKNAIKKCDGILTEKEKVEIINKCLTTDNIKGSDYIIEYDEFNKYVDNLYPYQVEKSDVKFRNILSFDVIPEVIYKRYSDEIDSKSNLLLNKKIDKLTKMELKNDIKRYTVPVGIYDIAYAIVTNIKLGQNESIHVVKCDYNELGFIRLPKNNKTKEEQEYDRFF